LTGLSLDDGVRATLDDGSVVHARGAVIAAGPWLPTSPALREVTGNLPLVVERQVQLWFPRPPGDLPAFIHFSGSSTFYAIPTGDSIKVCQHHGGALTTPDSLDRALRPQDEASVRGYLQAHVPSVDGPVLRSRVCMYTCTPDQHFLVGRLPRARNVVLLGGFSGHGYKMASVMGEIAAHLAIDGRSPYDLTLFDPERFAREP
jgi:glycine/D-amino acid oxidase-like deaminating enzyme